MAANWVTRVVTPILILDPALNPNPMKNGQTVEYWTPIFLTIVDGRTQLGSENYPS